MSLLVELPTEILLLVVDYLHLPAQFNLRQTCRSLKALVGDKVCEELKRIKPSYKTINGQGSGPWPWHSILLKILRGEVPATFISDVNGGPRCASDITVHPIAQEAITSYFDITTFDVERLRHVARESAWIEEAEREDIVEQILNGSDDAVLCLLIPMLPNLRTFSPPLNAVRLPGVFQSISQIDRTANPRPLSKLQMVSALATDLKSATGNELDSLSLYATAKDCMILINKSNSDIFPGWPSYCPRYRSSRLYIPQPGATSGVVFRGPFEVSHDWADLRGLTLEIKEEPQPHCYTVHGEINVLTGTPVHPESAQRIEVC